MSFITSLFRFPQNEHRTAGSTIFSCPLIRSARTMRAALLSTTTIFQVLVAIPLGRVDAVSLLHFGEVPAIQVAAQKPEMLQFNLLGPDRAKITAGYSGVTPMKVIAELNIPKDYVSRNFIFRQPVAKNTSSIPIVVLYPSIKGGANEAPSSKALIYAVIDAGQEDESRKGVRSLLSREGMKADPRLNIDGLCGYIDNDHSGTKGQEFYSSCDPAEQTFFIACFPAFKDRRSCSDTTFLQDQIGAELTYQYSLLLEHRAMLDALRRLVMSFVRPVKGK